MDEALKEYAGRKEGAGETRRVWICFWWDFPCLAYVGQTNWYLCNPRQFYIENEIYEKTKKKKKKDKQIK